MNTSSEPLPQHPFHGKGNKWAVLVGINKYQDQENYGNLHICVEDATKIREALMRGGFDQDRMHILTDKTTPPPLKEEILAELHAIAGAAEPDDVVLFYFSGHGSVDKGEGYLIPQNGKGITLRDTAIAMSRVKEILDQSPARAKVVILDACHSGISINTKGPRKMSHEFLSNVFENATGLAILSSCNQGQLSHEWTEKRCSAFTYYLLEAFQGAADRDKKGFVTVDDTNKYVTNAVKLWASKHQVYQSPTLNYLVSGDIVLVQYDQQPYHYIDRSMPVIAKRYLNALRTIVEQAISTFTQEQVWTEQCQMYIQALRDSSRSTILHISPNLPLLKTPSYSAVIELEDIDAKKATLCSLLATFLQKRKSSKGEEKQKKEIENALRAFLQDIIDAETFIASLEDVPDEEESVLSPTIDLQSHIGNIQAVREGRLHEEIQQQIADLGVQPKKPLQLPQEDILERFRAVPLHAIFLYSAEDDEVGQYLAEHAGELNSISDATCDIHPMLNQFKTKEDAYDYIQKLDVIRQSGFQAYSQLPGIFFHDHQGQSVYVPFDSSHKAAIVKTIRTLFEEIRKHPTLTAVSIAKERLQKKDLGERSEDIPSLHRMPQLGKEIAVHMLSSQQFELVQALQTLPPGDGGAYEELIKRVLLFCFADEFRPFALQEQVKTENQKRRRDFIIDNRDSTIAFWKSIKTTRHVEKILFDAKNYAQPIQYHNITSTLRYLRNKAFGNLLIILSRQGVKDLTEFIEEYSDNDTVVVFLNDDDVIEMIQLKMKGESASEVIAKRYYDFLSLK